jgi:hypothetical protein
MVPLIIIVAPSTIKWILKVLLDLFLLISDQQDWIEMACLHNADL